MSRSRFFCGPNPLSPGDVFLSEHESSHARGSRRLRVGDAITVFDGCGREGCGVIRALGADGVRVAVESVTSRPFDTRRRVSVAVAMPKGPRQDTLVEKCTELGVAEVWPMLCDRSVVKPETGRLARWRRTAIEASKQSGRAWLPEIQPVQQFTDVLALFDRYEATLIAHLNVSAGDAVSPPDCSTVLVLVGPEGGFCAEEYADALAHGAAHLDLGGTILRTETAAIAAVARLTRV